MVRAVILALVVVLGCGYVTPWEQGELLEWAKQERRESYVRGHSEIGADVRSAVLRGRLVMGMTRDGVYASWGPPGDVNRSVGSWGVHEQWVYGSSYLYFENGVLTGWQD